MKKTFLSTMLAVSILTGAPSAFAKEEPLKPIKEVFEPSGNFDTKTHGKVAVVAWNSNTPSPVGPDVTVKDAEKVKAENRAVLEQYIREAAQNGAEMVITPEFGVVGYPDIPELPSEEDEFRNRDDIKPYVETVPGPTTRKFSALAKELGIYIHVGFAEVDKTTDIYYNTVTAFDPTGKMVAKYRKANLFELENNFIEAGDKAVTYNSPFGKVGIIICADVYSTFPMNEYTGKVEVLALSTSWARMNTGMNQFTSSAKGAKAYMLAANQMYFPDSGVINKDGTKQSHIRQSEGVAYGWLPRVTSGKQGQKQGTTQQGASESKPKKRTTR